mgnify:CR=1 FL=1
MAPKPTIHLIDDNSAGVDNLVIPFGSKIDILFNVDNQRFRIELDGGAYLAQVVPPQKGFKYVVVVPIEPNVKKKLSWY